MPTHPPSAESDRASLTPAMRQYFAAKAEYPDAILLFRMGDFYEMFFDDALEAAPILDLTLTSRSKRESGEPIPMAGMPHHAAQGYIAKLVAHGKKVAICEQMADPSLVRGLVPRQVVRVVTPGVQIEADALDASRSNYLMAIIKLGADVAVAALEVSTGELILSEVQGLEGCRVLLSQLDPPELLLDKALESEVSLIEGMLPKARLGYIETVIPNELEAELLQVLGHRLSQLGGTMVFMVATHHLLAYVRHTLPSQAQPIRSIEIRRAESELRLDENVLQSLEILRPAAGDPQSTLIYWLDHTKTAMGARLLRKHISVPSMNLELLARRFDQIQALIEDLPLRLIAREQLTKVRDVERIVARLTSGLASPRDLWGLRESLTASETLRSRLLGHPTLAAPESMASVLDVLQAALADEPPPSLGAGDTIRDGFDPELDRLRTLCRSGKDLINALELREKERTGITSLKVRFTRVFGYYIEITRPNLSQVPSDFRRKQTVANGERFTTEELDTLQRDLEFAEGGAEKRESECFKGLIDRLLAFVSDLTNMAKQLAELDVSASWADTSVSYGWVRPTVDASHVIDILQGRHPVVEALLPPGAFVPNDVLLDAYADRLMLITGPNMAGKSTVMRQVALIVIMAQAGGFVPAKAARIGLVDKLFARVGASDNVARGQSTFMVEMSDAARILNRASSRSLVIIDELGRGTSTYDGLALAWAFCEVLNGQLGCRTMFATHYHELCALESDMQGIRNFNVSAKENRGDIVFLHALSKGGASRSYGLSVARLAGIPEAVLSRAEERLRTLETQASPIQHTGASQLDLFSQTVTNKTDPKFSKIADALHNTNTDLLTPIQALLFVKTLQTMLEEPQTAQAKSDLS